MPSTQGLASKTRGLGCGPGQSSSAAGSGSNQQAVKSKKDQNVNQLDQIFLCEIFKVRLISLSHHTFIFDIAKPIEVGADLRT